VGGKRGVGGSRKRAGGEGMLVRYADRIGMEIRSRDRMKYGRVDRRLESKT
jgi:hypothetical protein